MDETFTPAGDLARFTSGLTSGRGSRQPPRTSTNAVETPHGAVAVQWSVPDSPVGAVVLAHGLAEHAGRYERLRHSLHDAGYAFFSYNQRGHGFENAPAVDIPDFAIYVDEYASVVRFAKNSCNDIPCFLMGHSMGSIVALLYAERGSATGSGLILSAFAGSVRNDVPAFVKTAVSMASHIVPWLAVNSDLDVTFLTHDEEEQRRYLEDPKVNRRVTLQWLREMLRAARKALKHAGNVSQPVLMIHGGSDPIADVAGTELLKASLQVPCTISVYPGSAHEVLNETSATRKAATKKLIQWLNERSGKEQQA